MPRKVVPATALTDPGERVLGDVDAGEVVEVHAQREAELRRLRVREAAPGGRVHVGAQHVAARPRDVEAAQQGGEDDQGQQEREGGGDRCLDGDAGARAHVRRPLSSTR